MLAFFSVSLTSVLAKIWMMPLRSPSPPLRAGALRGPLESLSEALAVASAEALASVLSLGWPSSSALDSCPSPAEAFSSPFAGAFCSFFSSSAGSLLLSLFSVSVFCSGSAGASVSFCSCFFSAAGAFSASGVSSGVSSLAGALAGVTGWFSSCWFSSAVCVAPLAEL